MSAPARFTPDGGADVEARIARDVERVREALVHLFAGGRLLALALVGGYGRGEGGYRRDAAGAPLPANDYDFVLVHRAGAGLLLEAARLAKRLARELDVDFVDLGFWPEDYPARAPFTLFNAEVREGHRVLSGSEAPFLAIPPYRLEETPLLEATLLLRNRGAALLWGALLLEGDRSRPAPGDAGTFVRNVIEKTLLAAGDAWLIGTGRYHISYRERRRRLAEGLDLPGATVPPARLDRAFEWKFRPDAEAVREPDLASDWREARRVHEAAFRWIESIRLGRRVPSWDAWRREVVLAEGRSFAGRLRAFLATTLRRPGDLLFARAPGSLFLSREGLLLAELPSVLYASPLEEGGRGRGAGWQARARAYLRAWHPA